VSDIAHTIRRADDTASGSDLVRPDSHEELFVATQPSFHGRHRQTALVIEPALPGGGERHVQGNASFESAYAVRACQRLDELCPPFAASRCIHPYAR
jgi:hypothetical protein